MSAEEQSDEMAELLQFMSTLVQSVPEESRQRLIGILSAAIQCEAFDIIERSLPLYSGITIADFNFTRAGALAAILFENDGEKSVLLEQLDALPFPTPHVQMHDDKVDTSIVTSPIADAPSQSTQNTEGVGPGIGGEEVATQRATFFLQPDPGDEQASNDDTNETNAYSSYVSSDDAVVHLPGDGDVVVPTIRVNVFGDWEEKGVEPSAPQPSAGTNTAEENARLFGNGDNVNQD